MRVRHKYVLYLGLILFLLGLAMSTGLVSLTVISGPINIVVDQNTYRQYYRLTAEELLINTSLARPTGGPYMGLITIYYDHGARTLNIYIAGNGTIYILGKGPGVARPSWLAGAYVLAEARLGSAIVVANNTVVVDGDRIPVYGGAITGLFVNMKAPVPPITGKIIIHGTGYTAGSATVAGNEAGTATQAPPQSVAEKAVYAQKASLSEYLMVGGVILVFLALLL